jgi:hypothetical protein
MIGDALLVWFGTVCGSIQDIATSELDTDVIFLKGLDRIKGIAAVAIPR